MEAIFGSFLVLFVLVTCAESQLSTVFYSSSCPAAEAVVRSTVETHFNSDPTVAPGLLRLHFHDCFVQDGISLGLYELGPGYESLIWYQSLASLIDMSHIGPYVRLAREGTCWMKWALSYIGLHKLFTGANAPELLSKGCDGSILISGPSAERSAPPNIGLRGLDVIDDAKAKLESLCPGVVSCADILALTARDAVDLSGGPSWGVPLGRRDGRVSSAADTRSLPSPFESIAAHRQKFAAKGLNDHDLVTLVGAHTIGQTDCRFFQYRLYNFTPTGNSDPSINPSFVTQLQTQCPNNGNGLNRVALDKDSQTTFDVSFFKNVRDGKGILESDQRLWGDDITRPIVQNYAGNLRGLLGLRFNFDFPKAMIKMSSIDVKTGTDGEIRKICSKFN